MNDPEFLKSSSLVFFGNIPEQSLDKPFVLSALQDFEGSLLLLSDQRWPASLMLMWSACEKMIKASLFDGETHTIDSLNERKAWKLEEDFQQVNMQLTGGLAGAGSKLRKLRNDIIHQGASPEDDFKCLHVIFRGGVNYFESCLKFAVGNGMEYLMSDECNWFLSILQKTRKAVHQFKPSSTDPDLKDGMFFLRKAIQKCLAIRTPNQCFYPTLGYRSDYLSFDGECDAREDIYWKITRRLESRGLETCPTYVATEDGKGILKTPLHLKCPVCSGSGVIGFKCNRLDNNEWKFEALEAFCCLDADCFIAALPFYGRTFLRIFFEEALTDPVKMFLEKEGGEHGENTTFVI